MARLAHVTGKKILKCKQSLHTSQARERSPTRTDLSKATPSYQRVASPVAVGLSPPVAMAVAAPGQLNLDEAPSWGSRSVDCFEKLEQIGEGTYG
ncbi:hypothetical protein C2845_PM14G12400 [Panicum miliaceum]|uniref:Uncharacterized protein n=1 Tax=Panicum miliaceum TaxID=4540 RepID=A0A3L6PP23_PANMI|nr:hypothetical protein C2845_PM14G12400 [Panicum miliaceum]